MKQKPTHNKTHPTIIMDRNLKIEYFENHFKELTNYFNSECSKLDIAESGKNSFHVRQKLTSEIVRLQKSLFKMKSTPNYFIEPRYAHAPQSI